jgi:hypothetical protein
VYVTGRYTSGTAYSGCVNTAPNSVLVAVDAATSSPCSTGDFTSEINGLRLPALKVLDARFTKGFGLGGLNLTAYADVRNILNFTNIIRVFQGNGDIVNGWSSPPTRPCIHRAAGEANQNACSTRRPGRSISPSGPQRARRPMPAAAVPG